MNMLLWVLQVLAALLYGSSGVMKVFMFDKISQEVPSFGALPREAWMTLGILELVCAVGLIVPAAFHWQPSLTILAAAVLAIESLVFVGVHVRYREVASMILSGVWAFSWRSSHMAGWLWRRSSDRSGGAVRRKLDFCNTQRLHSATGYRSPIDFEARFA